MELDTTARGAHDISCLVNGPIETNTYVVVSDGEAAIIDPAWDGEELVRRVQEAHPGVQLKTIICTHGHADHVGGVAGVRRALGENVGYLLPEADAPMVAVNIEHQRASWGIETEDPGAPTQPINEGDVIAVGNVRLQVIATPGHTPGGVVLFAATEAGNVAFVGDTLFPGSHGRTDLAGGDEAAILQSLAKLARLLPADTTCFVGHGPATTMERELTTNPFLRGGAA